MIARGEGDLSATAIRELRRVPADGRSLVRHLDVVYCNYADAFPSAEFFLREVVSQLAKLPVGALAKSMLNNNVRTELCR